MKYHSKLTGTFLIGVFAANTALASTLPIKTQTTSTAITIGGKPGGCPTQLDSAKEGARYVAGMLTYVKNSDGSCSVIPVNSDPNQSIDGTPKNNADLCDPKNPQSIQSQTAEATKRFIDSMLNKTNASTAVAQSGVPDLLSSRAHEMIEAQISPITSGINDTLIGRIIDALLAKAIDMGTQRLNQEINQFMGDYAFLNVLNDWTRVYDSVRQVANGDTSQLEAMAIEAGTAAMTGQQSVLQGYQTTLDNLFSGGGNNGGGGNNTGGGDVTNVTKQDAANTMLTKVFPGQNYTADTDGRIYSVFTQRDWDNNSTYTYYSLAPAAIQTTVNGAVQSTYGNITNTGGTPLNLNGVRTQNQGDFGGFGNGGNQYGG